MLKLALCLSVTAEDLNLLQRYIYEDINILGTCYFVALDSTLKAYNFSKKRLQHNCFPVNVAKFLRTAF